MCYPYTQGNKIPKGSATMLLYEGGMRHFSFEFPIPPAVEAAQHGS
ncbi:MAG: hypothetical protein Q4D38_08455 [Planctomycetia bacterium]|nr:hypothetical protein [Planctomycetia bacterium]